jgi:hypothetical protein
VLTFAIIPTVSVPIEHASVLRNQSSGEDARL